jgi:beta-mannosidase
MKSLSLNGAWQLYHFKEGDYDIQEPRELNTHALQAIPAQVPGNVELDLNNAGQLPDPFFAANIRLLRELEGHEWWYVKDFDLSPDFQNQRVELVFEGLDTLATIWLNDVLIAKAANMLIPHHFEVTPTLKPGKNILVVRLASAVNAARYFQYEPSSMSWEHRYEGLFLRKAPHGWGWDIMPRLVSAGIWRDVRLVTIPTDAFDWIYYWTTATDSNGATLGVRFLFRTKESLLDGLSVHFHGVCEEHSFDYTWHPEFTADGCTIYIPDARLWWSKGLGKANLYTITAQLWHAGRLLAEHTDRVGLRKLVVDRSEFAGKAWSTQPAPGTVGRLDRNPDSYFIIYVNDTPVMVKGTNWVPLDAFPSRDAGRLEQALAMVDELGCNAIRCWGGNVYESDAFFDWCDAHGVLVWQDFAFACCIYPQTDSFLEQVRLEAEAVVQRLRNHPCLALWCGDNEIDMAYLSEGRDPGHNRLTREVLPRVIERLDPYRDFVPSSPYVPPSLVGHADAWQATPEQHLWGLRGYFKNPFYTHHSANFIGEIGYHGCPNPQSIEKFISPEALWSWQNNEEWQIHAVYHWRHHDIDRDRIQLMANQLREFFGFIPQDLETFALASQIVQAEAKKFFIESTRLRKWQTSGILWWNLIDGWPQFSDAIVDYYFTKKLAYEYIRRSQLPVCVVIGETGTGNFLPIVGCNDSLEDALLQFRVWDADTGEQAISGDFTLPANQNWQMGRIRTFASEQRLYLIEWEYNGQRFHNHYLVGTPPIDFQRYMSWLDKLKSKRG